jgi:hypothetical protein
MRMQQNVYTEEVTMSKGPRMSEQVKRHIAECILQNPNMQAKKILSSVENKFKDTGIDIPKLRTVQALAKQLKEEARQNNEEQPWSLATMDQAKMGWEAASFLLEAHDDLHRRQREGKLPWQGSAAPYISKGTLKEVIQAEKNGKEPERKYLGPPAKTGTVLTNRQAKWLWHIHLIVPGLELADLYPHVEPYAHREILAYYLREPFDTTDLDSALMNILRDIKKRGYYPTRNTSHMRAKTKKI